MSVRFRTMLSDLVKADTTNPPGNESRAVKVIAARLKKVGIPYEIVTFAPGRDNIVARLKGTGEEKPLLLLAHLDVVGTKDQKWSVPEHELTEKDGYLYGRGVGDDLGMVAANLEIFIELKTSGAALKRDVILAFTGDEESGGAGLKFLLANRPELVNAGIALNEGGRPVIIDGKVKYFNFQVAEKVYQDFTLSTKGDTGHSSVPRKDNSIYRMARALDRLGQFEAESRLIDATRAYFKELAKIETGEKAAAMRTLVAANGSKLPKGALKVVKADPLKASMLSTTCVATMLNAGTKANALPPEAHANVNCRLLPDETAEQVQARLAKVINDPRVEIKAEGHLGFAGPSPTQGEVPTAVREVVNEVWPGAGVVPAMMTGATDSRFLRSKNIQSYGVHPIAMEEADSIRAHGVDERLPVASIQPGLEFLHRLVVKLAVPSVTVKN